MFVLTPDSLRSEICNLEIAHARKRGKRILPILHQEVLEGGKLQGNILQAWYGETWEGVAHENWGTLKNLNWLFFRPSDDFQGALAQLIHDLNADLDHLKFHTRLTVRAVEWDNGGRKRDFVLRGDDLRRAVDWLSNPKTPPPTPLHHAYITASQIEENLDLQTRHYLLQARFGLVLAIITTLFLGYVAFAVQRQTLENNTSDLKNQLATHQAQVATLEAIITLSPAQCPTSTVIIACPTP